MTAADSKRDRQLRYRYGISLAAYNALHAAQGGCCAICRQPETAKDPKTGTVIHLAVDHDHDTGALRGLLCSRCNRALGYFGDKLPTLLAAAQYLVAHTPEK